MIGRQLEGEAWWGLTHIDLFEYMQILSKPKRTHESEATLGPYLIHTQSLVLSAVAEDWTTSDILQHTL